MNKATIATLSIVVLVIVGFFLAFSDRSERNNLEEVANGVDQTPAGYVVYTNEELGFSTLRPEEAEVVQEGADRIKFTVLGPDNPPASEITDGFTLTVHRDASTTPTTLEEYAQTRRVETLEHAEAQSELEFRNVNGIPAYWHEYENLLGSTSREYIFLPTSTQGYTVTHTITDPNNTGYENMVANMLESIEFGQE